MKRHEILLRHEKARESECARITAEKQLRFTYEFHRGVLPREDIEALNEELLEAVEQEWDANIRVLRVASNLRRSHVSFCKARMVHTSATSFVTYREQLANVAEVPRITAEIHSPPLELIENSLTSHAPPIEAESQTETLSS